MTNAGLGTIAGGLIGRGCPGRGGLGVFGLVGSSAFFASVEASSLSSCLFTATDTLLSRDDLLATEEVFEGIGFLAFASFAFFSFSDALTASTSSILLFLASFASACFLATSSPTSLKPVGFVGGFEALAGGRGFFKLAMRGRGARGAATIVF